MESDNNHRDNETIELTLAGGEKIYLSSSRESLTELINKTFGIIKRIREANGMKKQPNYAG